MSGNLHWLASYPKSGNTWMRILLTNYWRDGEDPADINELDGGPIASARSVFDENVGIEASDLTQDEIERLRPHVYDALSDRIGAEASGDGDGALATFLKVHDAFTLTSEGIPLISPAATAGAVYLVRNPFDVAVSFAHHGATSIDSTIRNMGNPSYEFANSSHRIDNQLRQRLLTWSRHVSSWVDADAIRTLVVRYEDLVADTGRELTRVLEFAGLEVDAARTEKAVEFSRFDVLQQQESEHGFREKLPKSESFFRSGRTDSWQGVLNADQTERIRADHGVMMERLGYA